MKLCEQCNNLLQPIYTNDEFFFECPTCKITYDVTPDDTMRFKKTDTGNIVMFKKIMKNAHKDSTFTKVEIDCTNCGKMVIARQTRVGSELSLLNKCTKCMSIWTT